MKTLEKLELRLLPPDHCDYCECKEGRRWRVYLWPAVGREGERTEVALHCPKHCPGFADDNSNAVIADGAAHVEPSEYLATRIDLALELSGRKE